MLRLQRHFDNVLKAFHYGVPGAGTDWTSRLAADVAVDRRMKQGLARAYRIEFGPEIGNMPERCRSHFPERAHEKTRAALGNSGFLKVAGAGFEQARVSPQETHNADQGDVNSDAIGTELLADPLFRRLVMAWPDLPEFVRSMLVEAAISVATTEHTEPTVLHGFDELDDPIDS